MKISVIDTKDEQDVRPLFYGASSHISLANTASFLYYSTS
ncbi:hypothetical protein SAMN02745781_04159 [Vibrio gazogenes DSM 21264]|uniref:Uncharacterized protein n=1 Tax=Vibrio gazogenes DSM 21264 = NBRC 103151 TaxID=1123492 RepID=A0A1M5HPY6_VIBGA|nr:hypothetical protein SAMN02745781_04159 [Vibrio gazogenes DSM 21264] [Vibrio gazogenes DSM 21264 = NBRC 103151]SJN55514.1 hypothetical protein BQ6471_01587 [Vibrio gazogenes]